MADARYKEMLVASSADDILLTTAFTGLQTNMLRPSIAAAGLDPDDLPAARRDRHRQGHRHRRARKPPEALEGYLERRAFHLGGHRGAFGRRDGRADDRGVRSCERPCEARLKLSCLASSLRMSALPG